MYNSEFLLMIKKDKERLEEALHVISATIIKCKKIHPKFVEGTSQYTLLKNRIKALNIAKVIIINDGSINSYKKDDLIEALKPITSIISKTEKAQLKFEKDSFHYNRFIKLIKAMQISKLLIEEEITKRD